MQESVAERAKAWRFGVEDELVGGEFFAVGETERRRDGSRKETKRASGQDIRCIIPGSLRRGDGGEGSGEMVEADVEVAGPGGARERRISGRVGQGKER